MFCCLKMWMTVINEYWYENLNKNSMLKNGHHFVKSKTKLCSYLQVDVMVKENIQSSKVISHSEKVK